MLNVEGTANSMVLNAMELMFELSQHSNVELLTSNMMVFLGGALGR